MPQETLRKHPLWRAEDLGKPIPDTKHAISMCLPRWQDVIGYEKRDPVTMERLQVGYPRFFYHPLVAQAFKHFGEGRPAQIYSTRAAAERCRDYLLFRHPEATVELNPANGNTATVIRYPEACATDAKDYWQHAGEGISSRHAEALLNSTPPPDASEAERTIRERVAAFTGTTPDNVYLFCSGMAAIHAAFLAVRRMHPDRPTAQYAFPYGDTLKMQNKLGNRKALFYSRGDAADLAQLESDLEETKISGLFCEFPTNPLLTCVDLPELRDLADRHGFPIIIDETLGACINQKTLALSDVSAISLTKFFSGTSDVMAGALVINPEAPFAEPFRQAFQTLHEASGVYPADLIRLEIESRNCRERVQQINGTALRLSEYLMASPLVESVFYPAFTDKEMYDRFRCPDGGYGGLLSFVLRDAGTTTETFYDALEITKGPNLGTSFSLCCPFVLIAHFDELEWAESAGASRYLIRISVGLEPAEELIARIRRALDQTSR